jgi:putative oxidoreductase
MVRRLEGKIAVVTGGTTGIGLVFTLATAVFFHNHFGDQNQFIHFFKNIAIAGGLLHVIAFGGGRVSLDGRRS